MPQNAAVESVENPLADEGPGSDIEQPDAGTFPLTVRDMFTNTHVVEVTPETRIFEVKELLRAEKDESMDYLDALVLLHNREPLDDEATVGSHGLSWETTVGISNQDPAKGRERGHRRCGWWTRSRGCPRRSRRGSAGRSGPGCSTASRRGCRCRRR